MGCPQSALRRSSPRQATPPGHHCQGAGQARRPRPTGEEVRHLRRQEQAHRPGPSEAPVGGLARGLGAFQTNTVYAARYRHLTTRESNKLTPTQAQSVIAAAILRHLHAVITTGQAWDPVIATRGTRSKETITIAA